MSVNKKITDTKTSAAVEPSTVLNSVNSSIALWQDNSVMTLGQNTVFPGAPVCNSNETAAIKAGTKVACQSPPIVTGTAPAKKT
jgi:hypothetical protein